jgi:hypothetical protein
MRVLLAIASGLMIAGSAPMAAQSSGQPAHFNVRPDRGVGIDASMPW